MKSFVLLFTCVLLVSWTKTVAQPPTPLRVAQTIPLSGVEGRIDHLAVDIMGRRLFVASLENNTLEVIDLQAGKRLRHIEGLHEPQGITLCPQSNRLYVANGASGTCMVYDGRSLNLLETLSGIADADNIRYDDSAGKVYIGYGGGAIAALDAVSGKRLANIPLQGHPESFQLEKKGQRLFVNVPTAGHIAVIDRTKNAVLATWAVTAARSNFPMALDEAHNRLFVGCRNPARLLVYDTTTGKLTSQLPIDGDTDDLFYDAERGCLYISCGAGFLDIVKQASPDHYKVTHRIPTAPGARTSLYVPEFKRIYLAVPHRGGQQAEIRVFTTP